MQPFFCHFSLFSMLTFTAAVYMRRVKGVGELIFELLIKLTLQKSFFAKNK